jgi:hypothetical protein
MIVFQKYRWDRVALPAANMRFSDRLLALRAVRAYFNFLYQPQQFALRPT